MRHHIACTVALFLAQASVAGAQDAAPDLDASRVKFALIKCDQSSGTAALVFGVVSKSVDLGNDALAMRVLKMGVRVAQAGCTAKAGRPLDVAVTVLAGDPSTLTNTGYDPNEEKRDANQFERQRALKAAYGQELITIRTGGNEDAWDASGKQLWTWYANEPRNNRVNAERRKAEQEKAQQRAESLAQQEQATKIAQQREQAEIAARSAAFVKANSVVRYVALDQLAANPFVYQGQVVAIYGVFEQMNSATRAVFSSSGGDVFVVSGVPTSRFTQQKSMVMLAGRVLGNIELQLPVVGPKLVPHVTFVGSAFCQRSGCADYSISQK